MICKIKERSRLALTENATRTNLKSAIDLAEVQTAPGVRNS